MVHTTSPYTIIHLRHPRPILWSEVMEELSRILGTSIVSYTEWISKLTTVQPHAGMAKFVGPALTLADQLRPLSSNNEALRVRVMENNGLSVFMDIEASLPYSATLSSPSLPRLNGDDIRKWVAYWRSIDALPVGL